MVDNSNMPHPKCLGSQKNPGTEPKTCERGPKLGFEYLPTSKTSHCVHGIPKLKKQENTLLELQVPLSSSYFNRPFDIDESLAFSLLPMATLQKKSQCMKEDQLGLKNVQERNVSCAVPFFERKWAKSITVSSADGP